MRVIRIEYPHTAVGLHEVFSVFQLSHSYKLLTGITGCWEVQGRFLILNSLLTLWSLGMQEAGDGLLCQHQAESALQGGNRHTLNYLFFCFN